MASNVTIGKLNATVSATSGQFNIVLNQVIEKTERAAAATKRADSAMRKASSGAANFASNGNQLAYLIDDLVAGLSQQGLSGALRASANNFVVLAASIGPMVAIATAVGFAFAQLGTRLLNLKDPAKEFADLLDSIAERASIVADTMEQQKVVGDSFDVGKTTGLESASQLQQKIESQLDAVEAGRRRLGKLSGEFQGETEALAGYMETLNAPAFGFLPNPLPLFQSQIDEVAKRDTAVKNSERNMKSQQQVVSRLEQNLTKLREAYVDAIPEEFGTKIADISNQIASGEFDMASNSLQEFQDTLTVLDSQVESFLGDERFELRRELERALKTATQLQDVLSQRRDAAVFEKGGELQAAFEGDIIKGANEFIVDIKPDEDAFSRSIDRLVEEASRQFSALEGVVGQELRETTKQSVLDAASAALRALTPNIQEPGLGSFQSVGAAQFGSSDAFSLINRAVQGNTEDQKQIAVYSKQMASALQKIEKAVKTLEDAAQVVK